MVLLATDTIKREVAEWLIVRYQRRLLRRSHYRIMCEYYAAKGGPCEGLNHFSDEELIERYRRDIPGIQKLHGRQLLDAVARFEERQLEGTGGTTCSIMERAGRLCDGLSRFTNLELTTFFGEALGGRRVVD